MSKMLATNKASLTLYLLIDLFYKHIILSNFREYRFMRITIQKEIFFNPMDQLSCK